MGEGKRRATVVPTGEFGPASGDPELLGQTTRALETLLPHVAAAVETEGWPAVLNALNTLAINFQLEVVGEIETARCLRNQLRDLSRMATHKRATERLKSEPAEGMA